MPADVLEVTKRFMREPVQILVKKEELTLEGIKQFFILVEKEVGVELIIGHTCETSDDLVSNHFRAKKQPIVDHPTLNIYLNSPCSLCNFLGLSSFIVSRSFVPKRNKNTIFRNNILN